jgi:purine-binding chemotaxis protein CheW
MNETFARSAEAQAREEDILQMVGFEVAGELFGVDILMVQEIIQNATITAIPDSPEFIEGVINLRGNIIPIIDLRKRLKLSSKALSAEQHLWIIILNISGRVTGFVVDRVTRVIKVPAGTIKPPPEMVVAGLKSHYISGVCKLGHNLLAMLDFNRILVVDEFKKLTAFKRQQSVQ